MKEAGVQESERKIKETFDKQVDEQTKEKEGITKVFDSVIKNKNEKFDKLVEKYNQAIKVRDQDIDKSKTEIIKIYTSILRQAKVIDGIENGKYSNGMVTMTIPDKPPLPRPSDFPMLYKTLKEKNGVLINENGKTYRKIDVSIRMIFIDNTLRKWRHRADDTGTSYSIYYGKRSLTRI